MKYILSFYQTMWMLESHAQQRLAWKDAERARFARARAEALSAAQQQAMANANPTGRLGVSHLGDVETLKKGGLL